MTARAVFRMGRMFSDVLGCSRMGRDALWPSATVRAAGSLQEEAAKKWDSSVLRAGQKDRLNFAIIPKWVVAHRLYRLSQTSI